MSMRDLNAIIRDLIDKEIEKILNSIKEETRDIIYVIDRKIEELNQYLKFKNIKS